MNNRLEALGEHPFRKLDEVLAPFEPGGKGPPLMLSAGDPLLSPPAVVDEILHENFALWGRYAPNLGTPEFRRAVAAWLTRRYGLPAGMVDPERNVAPCPGTREALFLAAQVAVPDKMNGKKPAVLLPNPGYHVYTASAIMAGGEPVFLPATAETGFLPDRAAIPREVLGRVACAYLCTPGNPQGAIASLDELKAWIGLAREYNFTLIVDECYAEIYFDKPPPGGLEACAALGGSMDNVIVLHSLSKRSSVPGLRSGFVAGDAKLLKAYVLVLSYGGVATPLPVLAAATALWQEETHVDKTRAYYRANFEAAREVFKGRNDLVVPQAGFFLWLDVGDGEKAMMKLWREAGIRVLPGAYLGRNGPDGRNPGQPYVRIAMIYDRDTTQRGLERLAKLV